MTIHALGCQMAQLFRSKLPGIEAIGKNMSNPLCFLQRVSHAESKQVDVWALGCLVVEVISNRLPHEAGAIWCLMFANFSIYLHMRLPNRDLTFKTHNMPIIAYQ